MANFAIVENDIVVDFIFVENSVILDENGEESEALGKAFLSNLFGYDEDSIVQASYSNSFRGVYPGVGYTYNRELDIFISPVDSE